MSLACLTCEAEVVRHGETKAYYSWGQAKPRLSRMNQPIAELSEDKLKLLMTT